MVFADPVARRDLERIVHPAVRARAAELERAADPAAVVVHVIPLLVETGQQEDFDVVVTVDVDHETQIRRLMARNGFSLAEAESRIAAQASREARMAASDVVVDNTADVDLLRAQITAVWGVLTSAGT
jgi:dephospho-CoA kinase